MSEDNTTKPPKGIRSDNVQLMQISVEIKEMLVNLKTDREICTFLSKKYDKSYSVIKGYVNKATEEFHADMNEDIEKKRSHMLKHLRKQYYKMTDEAAVQENPAQAIKYEQIAIQYLDRYISLHPNGLRPEDEAKDNTINITFNKVTDDGDTDG